MADSNITKQALSAALKELMEEQPFEKISVSDICQRCHMNRKSFYYHFRDKYDLANWIFDTEFIAFARKQGYTVIDDFLVDLCHYFYENRGFYQKVLAIQGQDCFANHFKEVLIPLVNSQLQAVVPSDQTQEIYNFQVAFLTDAAVGTLQRWISEKDCIPPEKFLSMLRSCIQMMAIKVCNDLEEQQQTQ